MKKYLLGLFAVVLAIGFSAFTAPEKSTSGNLNEAYWFYVESNHGADASFTNSTATFIAYTENAPAMDCSGAGNKCVIKFNPGDLNIITPGVEAEIDDAGGTSPKSPLSVGRERTGL